MSALLNHTIQGTGQPLILIHGLFGSLANLGLLARDFSKDYQVISVDLRNHGLSFHHNEHSYQALAEDLLTLFEHLNINHAIVIGHSMGGKVAMKLAEIAASRISKLVILDMAPVDYQEHRHESVFRALNAIESHPPTSRSDALQKMAEFIELDGVRQFLGKSLYRHPQTERWQWRFNVTHLSENYANIIGWQPIKTSAIPTLFIKGGDSDYLLPEHQPAIQAQFSNAKAHVISHTGHWLHAEKPELVIRAIRKFLAH
ncbi:alpha/beta fold hydrolase [Vibrio sp. SM6]|uniref:Alpha/beta fold hydrolase n=1 Tax=Vibrio agarilyticus TaxID=2726741 RepID=A0A7X8TMQ9_9VIBR|nr:alpha/beta fold hydrolase [Vibrio agarilyticus]NLS11586.1 alpha/beta fold hydrolase [Vibrio agarilyticus]